MRRPSSVNVRNDVLTDKMIHFHTPDTQGKRLWVYVPHTVLDSRKGLIV